MHILMVLGLFCSLFFSACEFDEFADTTKLFDAFSADERYGSFKAFRCRSANFTTDSRCINYFYRISDSYDTSIPQSECADTWTEDKYCDLSAVTDLTSELNHSTEGICEMVKNGYLEAVYTYYGTAPYYATDPDFPNSSVDCKDMGHRWLDITTDFQ